MLYHEMSILFSLKNKKNERRLLQILLGALRVNRLKTLVIDSQTMQVWIKHEHHFAFTVPELFGQG